MMTTHKELNKETSLQTLETARDEWMEQAVNDGFLTLCYLAAIELGKVDGVRIQGPRKGMTSMHVMNLLNGLEIVVFSSIGDFLPEIKEFEEAHSVLVGWGSWPRYKELYCNVTLSNDEDREAKDYEFFIPGKWQEQVNTLYDEVHAVVSQNAQGRDKKRKRELLDQLLIGKEV